MVTVNLNTPSTIATFFRTRPTKTKNNIVKQIDNKYINIYTCRIFSKKSL